MLLPCIYRERQGSICEENQKRRSQRTSSWRRHACMVAPRWVQCAALEKTGKTPLAKRLPTRGVGAQNCSSSSFKANWIRQGTCSSRRIQSRVIVEPAEFSEAIVVETDLQGLPGVQRAAANALQSVVYAAESDGLTALQRGDPLCTPPPDDLVGDAAAVGHKLLALAERQLVAAAEMEHVADVEVRQLVVLLDPEPGNVRRAVADIVTTAVQQIAGVGHGPRPRVTSQEVQAAFELLLDARLQTVVVATTFCLCLTAVTSEVGERHESGRFHCIGLNGSGAVVARKGFQVAGQRRYVRRLERH